MEFKRAKIVACKPRTNYRVWIRFDDGLQGEVDLSDLVGQGIFEAWNSVEFFSQVRVDPKTDTLPGEKRLTWIPMYSEKRFLRQLGKTSRKK